MRWLIDYDSTLADTTAARVAAINKEFGTSYTPSGVVKWHNYDSQYMVEEHDEWSWGNKCFFSLDWQANVPPVPYAIEGLHHLLEKDEAMIVSDRPPVLYDVTRDWLDRQGFDMVRLLFTKHKASKSGDHKGFTKSQAAYLYKLKGVVEDAPHHATVLADREYIDHIYLLETPYNQGITHEKIIRIPDWRALCTI